MSEFAAFPKIPRLRREVIVTEKIDGTNASVHVGEDGVVRAASRSRWITPADDNFGFARWVADHEDELRTLGPGAHFGEWWGAGIQRRYGLDHKRFSLFNTSAWGDAPIDGLVPRTRPACCHVVPVIARAVVGFDSDEIASALAKLRAEGSVAAPGFMRPEGIVVFHTAARSFFKVTLEKDDEHKGSAR